jgi:hypothetical protein
MMELLAFMGVSKGEGWQQASYLPILSRIFKKKSELKREGNILNIN